jgi:hypothetical protein
MDQVTRRYRADGITGIKLVHCQATVNPDPSSDGTIVTVLPGTSPTNDGWRISKKGPVLIISGAKPTTSATASDLPIVVLTLPKGVKMME